MAGGEEDWEVETWRGFGFGAWSSLKSEVSTYLPVTLQILEQILNSHVVEACRSVVISPSHENFGAPLVPRRNSIDFSTLG